MFVQVLCSFLHQVICFLAIELSSVYIFDINPLLGVSFIYMCVCVCVCVCVYSLTFYFYFHGNTAVSVFFFPYVEGSRDCLVK